MTADTRIDRWDDRDKELAAVLVGHRVVATDMADGSLTLDNGTVIRIEKGRPPTACSFVDLKALSGTENVITAVKVDDDETDDSGDYKAWIQVITAADEIVRIAEAEGNPGNGYYLHGFGLEITVRSAGDR